jgi:hypothetical protein
MSILVLIQASTGVTWYNINTVLIYYSIQVGINVIYTVLVTKRLLAMREEIKQIVGEYSSIYDTVIFMIIESTMLYIPFVIVFIFAFAFHSDISNLWFLGIGHVQVSRRKPVLSASLIFFNLGNCSIAYHRPCSKGAVNYRTCTGNFIYRILRD